MATKSFGYTGAPSNASYAGSGQNMCVGQQLTMPEKGKIKAIRLKLAKYASTTVPKVWGMIWARPAGTILSQSANYVSPTNLYDSPGALQTYEITMPGTEIAAGTAIWAGFFKDSSGANLAPYWGWATVSGQTWNARDGSNATPQAFSITDSFSNQSIYIEIVYETGGQIKVFGTAIAPKPIKVWNGATWAGKPLKHWNGSAWKESNS